MPNMDLDVDSPDKVSAILRTSAQEYYEAAGELESAWQSRTAGKPWTAIARILEKAADQIETALSKIGY